MTDSVTTNVRTLFSVGQIRLAELSVYNWGSFDGLHSARIDPEGTLITGDNGSGKSTLIDGLMALLLPAGKATFNMAAAQGDRTDRTLLSYIRGSFGSAHDGGSTRVKSKRNGPVCSGLSALYRADDGSVVTLAALFWTTQSNNILSEVKRIYIAAQRSLELKVLLQIFGEGNVRALKQALRDDPAVNYGDSSFSDYRETYLRLLHMENRNAPALLARALGLKKIDDLTALIRDLVLEPSTVKDDAHKVVDEFADLVAIHEQLLDARKQREQLAKLPELLNSLSELETKIATLNAENQGLPAFFAELTVVLWSQKIEKLRATLETLALNLKQIAEAENEAGDIVEQRHADYLQAGGDRMEKIETDLKTAREQLTQINAKASEYQRDSKMLALDESLREDRFLANQAQASVNLDHMAEERVTAQDKFGGLSAELVNTQTKQKELEGRISRIKARPDSNIKDEYQSLRDEMVTSLGLGTDKCIFIGELLGVIDSERPWQGAIERALGGLRTTLAVPNASFSMVTRWLNERHTGLHVRVQVVPEIIDKEMPVFMPDGFLKKLEWRKHPYREWLKRHLAKFDLHCVASTQELDITPFSMTKQGLIHQKKGRFEKKDQYRIDDRNDWQLGFSNRPRLALLQQEQRELTGTLSDTMKALEHARAAMDEVGKREALWTRLTQYQWNEINAPHWEAKVTRLQKDLLTLRQNEGDLGRAKQRWETAKSELQQIKQKKEAVLSRHGGFSNELANAEKNRSSARETASVGLENTVRESLNQRVGQIQEEQLDQILQIEASHRQNINQSLEKWRSRKDSAGREATGIMASFRSKWNMVADQWGADLASLEEYIHYLNQLDKEGLPALVEQFKQRLNKHATQSLARIRQKLDSERDEILERIDIINRVLARTEFKKGSHLKLDSRTEQYPHVQDFNRQLLKVLSQATSDDHEARFHQLRLVVEILDKASNPSTSGTLESLRLLDPRYQMSFYAEELDTRTKEVRDVLASSSGKSGGEKESFAGTIVAASLAYVLTPDGYDQPVYSTVFLDEAFSNTAEAVSRRVLRVFRELKIHVNLITPYKNLNLARESAKSLLIAERDEERHESHLCEVSWEEIDRRLEEQRGLRTKSDAELLGIELEEEDIST